MRTVAAISAVTLAMSAQALAQSGNPVTIDNFIRAESDHYMSNAVKEGGLSKLYHRREPASVDNQIVIRLNRDTLYSSGVFDLDAGPVMIAMPDAGKRLMSRETINQDHYARTFYGKTPHTFTRENVGTRYMIAAIRTFVDPNDTKDVEQVHALQDAIKVSQKAPGKFDVPEWDQAGLKKIRDALLVLGETTGGFKRAFGTKDQVDPVRHLIATAAGWGGNPDKDATYLSITPAKNDGATVYRLNVKDVPVDGFWSISVYNADGYFEENDRGAYNVNSVTATKDPDGSVTASTIWADAGEAVQRRAAPTAEATPTPDVRRRSLDMVVPTFTGTLDPNTRARES